MVTKIIILFYGYENVMKMEQEIKFYLNIQGNLTETFNIGLW